MKYSLEENVIASLLDVALKGAGVAALTLCDSVRASLNEQKKEAEEKVGKDLADAVGDIEAAN